MSQEVIVSRALIAGQPDSFAKGMIKVVQGYQRSALRLMYQAMKGTQTISVTAYTINWLSCPHPHCYMELDTQSTARGPKSRTWK